MSTLLCWSLLAVSAAFPAYSNPLSTFPYNGNRQHSPLALAPLMHAEHPHGTINNSYIVMLKPDVLPSIFQSHFNFLSKVHDADPLLGDVGSGIRHVYDGHIKGYSGMFTDGVVDQIRQMPEVDYVERDQIVKTTDVQKQAPWVSLTLMMHRHHSPADNVTGSCPYQSPTQT